jgi:hypothetical protein
LSKRAIVLQGVVNVGVFLCGHVGVPMIGSTMPLFLPPSRIAMTRYRHYKGGIYEYIDEAILEADLTPMIIYRAADGRLWLRPREVFFEKVEVDGRQVPRFEKIED